MTRSGPLVDESEVIRKTLSCMAIAGGSHCLPYAMTIPAWFWDRFVEARECDKRVEYHADTQLLFFIYGPRKVRLDRAPEEY